VLASISARCFWKHKCNRSGSGKSKPKKLIRQDDRHAVVNGRHELVRLTSDDRAGPAPLVTSRRFPAFPEANEDERRIVRHSDRIGLFNRPSLLPLEEGICRQQASPFLEGSSVRWRRVDCFDPSVDRLAGDFLILRPERNQSPTNGID
jgi:hypothetical protein